MVRPGVARGARCRHHARAQATEHGLAFPGAQPTSITDFLYFATSVSTTFSASDVSVVTLKMRRIVIGHSLLAFAFNAVIVAIVVSALVGTVA